MGRKMPAVKGIAGPYRVFFFSFDCDEPKHVHIQRERMECKFWLDPIGLAGNNGFPQHELNRIRALLREHLEQILEAWDEHCGE